MGHVVFRCISDSAGRSIGMERMTDDWPAEIEISRGCMENTEPHLISHGDGLVTFHCTEEEATYGLTGIARTLPGYRDGVILRAQLLGVRPLDARPEGED